MASDRGAARRPRVFVAGATGYIGRHVVHELVERGYDVVAFARPRSGIGGASTEEATRLALPGAEVRFGDVTDRSSVSRDGLRGEFFDAVVSCIASRTGAPDDAWRIDHRANLDLLRCAQDVGVEHFVLLSAICVQKPRLAFQRAKLAFERALIDSGMTYSIVRPTAFFKSLAGQVEAVKRGKRFVVFGDGQLTACTPISERELARFLADCLEDPAKRNAVLPIGGPGPAITPLEQGAMLAELCGTVPRYRRVPVGVMDAIIAVLGTLGRVIPSLHDKAELARIGRYYGTESMLLWDEEQGRYDAAATPSFGSDTLRDFYARVLDEGLAGQELGDQAVFGSPRTPARSPPP
jgi:divinyl chlorophyllide a 8-vinyl-reductase